MRFLKKASYQDILGITEKDQGEFIEDITDRYCEYELYLSQKDLKELLPEENESTEIQSEKENQILNQLTSKLKEKGEAISAIHCPESLFKTYNERNSEEKSTNYLSLCECIRDPESQEILEKVIQLAIKINQGQYESSKGKDIIIILHEGCEIGCSSSGENRAACIKNDLINKTNDLIRNLSGKLGKIDFKIKIAIENITPFYSVLDKKIPVGENCWWDATKNSTNEEIFNEGFFNGVNKKQNNVNIKTNEENEERQEVDSNKNNAGNQKITIGACIDFCHIIASYNIKNKPEDRSEDKLLEDKLLEYIERYSKKFETYKEYIYLFHVSNYGKNGEHGQNFSTDEHTDVKIIEKIRDICKEVPEALITFEMADGEDVEKARKRFDEMLYFFSKKHVFGELGRLLKKDDNDGEDKDCNKDLREFFDNLFELYTCDYEDIFTISSKAYEIKEFIFENTHNKEGHILFNYSMDRDEEDVALLRLKAYIYYTRFCNLGEYLAKNHYTEDSFLGKENVKEDFGLTMKYFMFNDIWQQCGYTGLAFKFLIDFLPRKETVYRFYDEIDSLREITAKDSEGWLQRGYAENLPIFQRIIEQIKLHVTAKTIKNGKGNFYSMGKNFGECLFKYYHPHNNIGWDNGEWTLRIYENLSVNYIETTRRKYSIPAFLQIQSSIEEGDIKNICMDISCFSGGLGNGNTLNDTSTLVGFTRKFNDKDLRGVGSIAEGEVIATYLPEPDDEYQINTCEWFLLKKMYEKKYMKEELVIEDFKAQWDNITGKNSSFPWNSYLPDEQNIRKLNIDTTSDEKNLKKLEELINNKIDVLKDLKQTKIKKLKDMRLYYCSKYGINEKYDIYKEISKKLEDEYWGE